MSSDQPDGKGFSESRRKLLFGAAALLPSAALARTQTPSDGEDPCAGDLLAEEGLRACGVGDYVAAVACFEKALSKGVDRVSSSCVWETWGEALIELDDLAGADELFKRWTTKSPRDQHAWLNRGSVCAHRGRYDEAEVCYRRAEELKPDSAELWVGRAALDLYRGDPETALAKLETAERLNPSLAYVYSCRVLALAQLDRFKEARTALKRAILTGYDKCDNLRHRIRELESLARSSDESPWEVG